MCSSSTRSNTAPVMVDTLRPAKSSGALITGSSSRPQPTNTAQTTHRQQKYSPCLNHLFICPHCNTPAPFLQTQIAAPGTMREAVHGSHG